MAAMGRVTLRWPIAGAVLGALGNFVLLLSLGAVINGVEVGRGWELAAAVACPAALFTRGFWWPLVLDCLLYALVITALRFTWIRLRR